MIFWNTETNMIDKNKFLNFTKEIINSYGNCSEYINTILIGIITVVLLNLLTKDIFYFSRKKRKNFYVEIEDILMQIYNNFEFYYTSPTPK